MRATLQPETQTRRHTSLPLSLLCFHKAGAWVCGQQTTCTLTDAHQLFFLYYPLFSSPFFLPPSLPRSCSCTMTFGVVPSAFAADPVCSEGCFKECPTATISKKACPKITAALNGGE